MAQVYKFNVKGGVSVFGEYVTNLDGATGAFDGAGWYSTNSQRLTESVPVNLTLSNAANGNFISLNFERDILYTGGDKDTAWQGEISIVGIEVQYTKLGTEYLWADA